MASIGELARSCAKGDKQYAFVNELLCNEAYWYVDKWHHVYYGNANLNSRSFYNLEKRLESVGFDIYQDYDSMVERRKVTMRFIGKRNS